MVAKTSKVLAQQAMPPQRDRSAMQRKKRARPTTMILLSLRCPVVVRCYPRIFGVRPEALGCTGHEKHDTGVALWTDPARFAAVGTGVGGIGVGVGVGIGVGVGTVVGIGVVVGVAANDCRATLPRP